MSVRVAINGFGRIGRNVFRAARKRDADFEIVAVNDITDARDARAPAEVRLACTASTRARSRPATGRPAWSTASECAVLAERDPAALPWSDLGVEVVVESTGLFTKRDGAAKHLEAGARR